MICCEECVLFSKLSARLLTVTLLAFKGGDDFVLPLDDLDSATRCVEEGRELFFVELAEGAESRSIMFRWGVGAGEAGADSGRIVFATTELVGGRPDV